MNLTCLPARSRHHAVRLAASIASSLLLSAPVALAQSLTVGPNLMLNQQCPSCDVQNPALFVDPSGNVFANWESIQSSGDRSARTVAMRFSALTGKWGVSPIGLPEANASVQIGYDKFGNALAIWDTSVEGTITFFYAHYSAQQRTWTRGTRFWSESEIPSARLVVGPDGSAFVEGYARNGQVLFRFDPATRTMRQNGMGSIATDFTLDRKGNALHLTVDRAWSSPVDQFVYGMRFDATTGQWSDRQMFTPQRRRTDGLSTDYPQVILDRNGNGMGMWSYRDDVYGEPYQMASARYLARTGKWIVKRIPITANGPVYQASMATDKASNVYAVWSQTNSAGRPNVVFAKYSSATGAWSTPRSIQSGTSSAWKPQIVADNQGNVVAAWIQKNSAGKYVQTAARYRVASDTWEKPVTVQQDANANSYATRLGMDNRGKATVLWLQEGLPLLGGNPTYKVRTARLTLR